MPVTLVDKLRPGSDHARRISSSTNLPTSDIQIVKSGVRLKWLDALINSANRAALTPIKFLTEDRRGYPKRPARGKVCGFDQAAVSRAFLCALLRPCLRYGKIGAGESFREGLGRLHRLSQVTARNRRVEDSPMGNSSCRSNGSTPAPTFTRPRSVRKMPSHCLESCSSTARPAASTAVRARFPKPAVWHSKRKRPSNL